MNWMQKIRASFDERALPLWIIGLGILLRIYAAVSHLDISHPDEHFQTLEPASHVVYGFGWMSWEWSTGTRSWFIPGLYVPVLWVFKLFGVQGGPSPIIACRLLMVALSGVLLWRYWVLLKESGFKTGARLLSLALIALTPACVAWGAMTLSDVWAMVFLWTAMPFLLRSVEEGKHCVLAGAWLGLSFLARIQMAIWPVGIAIVLIFRGKSAIKTIWQLALGYSAAVFFQGILDWTTWGSPFHSVIANIEKNLLENVASFYGTAPWYEYLISLPRQIGVSVVVLGLAGVAVALITRKGKFRERDVLIAVPALLFLLIHSKIAHKELRFIFPIVPAFYYFAAWSVSAFEPARWLLRKDLAAAVVLLVAIVGMGSVYSDDHTYPFDLSELTRKIREDGGLRNGGCLLLVDHYWIWTRGELMIGAPVQFMEISSNKTKPTELLSCPYAISLPGREGYFGPNWVVLEKDNHGQTLLKRITN